MEGFNSYEYGAEQKAEGKFLVAKLLLLFLYVAYTVAYFVIIFVTRIFPLGALIPVTLWMLIFFTWRYISPDYKYEIEGGTFTFYKNYGKTDKSKKKKSEFKISGAEAIAPIDSIKSEIKAFAPKRVFNAIPYKASPDQYAAIYTDTEGVKCVLYFVATAQSLKLLHLHNSRTVLEKTAK